MIIRPKTHDRANIYLSGGMQFAHNLGAGWRLSTSEKISKMKYFPLDITDLDVAYNNLHGKPMVPEPGQDPSFYKANFRKHFVETDLKLIKENSDALIVYYDESARRGAGTVSEVQYAYLLNLPIFLVADYPSLDAMQNDVSGWLLSLTTKYFITFDDLYEYLDKLPYGILKKDVYGNHGVDGQYLCSLTGEVFTKKKNKFVSEVRPLYSQNSVEVVHEVYENHKDRYQFFMEYLTEHTNTNFKGE